MKHFATLDAHLPFRDFEYVRTDAQGKERVLRVSGVPVRGIDGEFVGYRGSGRDVTPERVERRRARRAEDRLQESLNYLPEGVALFDAEDILVACNPGYASHFVASSSPEECVGRSFESLFRITLDSNYRLPGPERDRVLAERVAAHRAGTGRPINIRLDDGRSVVLRDYRTWFHQSDHWRVIGLRKPHPDVGDYRSDIASQFRSWCFSGVILHRNQHTS